MTLPVYEFMRRFLQHVLPAGFVRIRYFGLWHPCQRHKMARIRQQLAKEHPGIDPATLTFWFRPLSQEEKQRCPACGEGSLVCIGEFEGTRRQLPHRQRRRLLPTERRWLRRRVA
jgi:Putative transposase